MPDPKPMACTWQFAASVSVSETNEANYILRHCTVCGRVQYFSPTADAVEVVWGWADFIRQEGPFCDAI
jgi:hypothetical protein